MRILITGATGFLGNNLVRQLIDDRHDIVATVRNTSDPRPLSGLNVDAVHVNLNQANEIGLAISDVELVIHCAALVHIGWKKREASQAVNVDSTRLLAQACRRKGIRLIHVSSVDTLAVATGNEPVDETQTEPPKSENSYVVTKRVAEQVVLKEVAQGLEAVIVNPGFMVGPWDWKPSSGKMMLALHKIPFLHFAPAGGGSIADVRDVAGGIISAMRYGRSGERYILGGENMSYLELWQLIAKVIQRRPPVKALPDWIASCTGKVGDLLARITGRESELNSAATSAGQRFHWYTSQKAEQELGYQIGNIEDALADAWDWFQRYGYV